MKRYQNAGLGILDVLCPLPHELDAALAQGDQGGAVQTVYRALRPICHEPAAHCSEALGPGQVWVHGLLIDLQDLPLEARLDGTLVERGIGVRISCRTRAVKRSQADLLTHALTDHCSSIQPLLWLVVPERQELNVDIAEKQCLGPADECQNRVS
jgi:hypothetical protein